MGRRSWRCYLRNVPIPIGVLDVFCGELVPPARDFPADRPAIVKATISSERSFAEQRERFEPDHSVLVLRHPCHVYVLLR